MWGTFAGTLVNVRPTDREVLVNMALQVCQVRQTSSGDPTEISPLSRDRCSNTPVALCFLWYRRLSLLHPQVKMAYRSPKTDLRRGVSQKKLASEAYRAVGGVARNSIANRAIVGH